MELTPASAGTWHGFYVDATSYAPGDAIKIYASSSTTETVYRLVRLDTNWTEITRTQPMTVSPQETTVGSFIEFPSVSLSGRISFTLEGWLHPTLLGGDLVVVAGQFGLTEAAAGIVISPSGQLAAYVSDTPQTDQTKLAVAPAPINFENWLDRWHHLALTYDNANVRLYIDGVLAAQRAQTGPVAQVAAPFRLGARTEAPGNLTGVLDGRLDSWALWPAALSADQIETRRQRGLSEGDPIPANLNNVDLYVGFEDAYPNVSDSSHNGYVGAVINHGNPGVAGVVTDTGHAFRVNHDQIVDAGWQKTAELTVPQGTASGMYAIQALHAPFTATQTGDRLSVRAFAIRPAAGAPHAPIAVVLPTNTWLAYNHWPGSYDFYLAGTGITPRSRYPGGPEASGGNNSAYGFMGDQASLAYHHGLRRPSREMSPIATALDPQGSIVRAPGSMYLVQWLDAHGFAYDVYSDEDFDAGSIPAGYHVLMPNAHHEYWSDGMLAALTRHLDSGGSVVAPAGNMFGWRTVYGENHSIEVRKFGRALIVGKADMFSGIDGVFMGGWGKAAVCNSGHTYYGEKDYQALGTSSHLIHPCKDQPFCYGQWQARNASHWLWQGSGLEDDDLFGIGRPTSFITPTYAVGHEADTWVEGMPLPGLAAGQQPVILAEGTKFDYVNSAGKLDTGGTSNLLNTIGVTVTTPSCEEFTASLIGTSPYTGGVDTPPTRAGTILYFPHTGGGNVLVIGASATPWALASDTALSGLLQRALSCFALDEGCGYRIHLPVILRRGSYAAGDTIPVNNVRLEIPKLRLRLEEP